MDEKDVKKKPVKKTAKEETKKKTTTTKKSTSAKSTKKKVEEKVVKEEKNNTIEEVKESIVKEEKDSKKVTEEEKNKSAIKEEKVKKVPNKEKRKKIMVWSIVSACILALALTLYFVVYFQRPYSLKSLINVSVEGYNGYASLNVSGKEVSKDVQRVLNTARVKYSKTENISNGDEIVIEIEYDEKTAKYYRVKIGKKYKFKVTGLPEGETLDVFKDLKFEYENKSPYLKVSVSNDKIDTRKYRINYVIESLDKDKTDKNYFKNGEKIKVKVTYNEDDLHQDGFIISEEEKEYVIPNNDSYIRDEKDLTDEMKKQIKDEMIKDIKTYATSSKVKEVYCSKYTCDSNNSDDYYKLNENFESYFMYIRYKDNVQKGTSYGDSYHTDVVGSFKVRLNSNTNNDEVLYCTVHYDNIYITKDGKLSDLTKNNNYVTCGTKDSKNNLKSDYKTGSYSYTTLVEIK